MLFTFEVAFSVPIEINIDAYFVAFYDDQPHSSSSLLSKIEILCPKPTSARIHN